MVTHTETYKGYKINIIQDTYAENPYKFCDGNAPLIAYYDNDYQTYGNNQITSLNDVLIMALTETKNLIDLHIRDCNENMLETLRKTSRNAINY